MKSVQVYESPLGTIYLTGEGAYLTGAWFSRQKYFAPRGLPEREGEGLPVFSQTIAWLDAYFAGKPLPAMPPLKPYGTPFQKQVWQILTAIPYGHTMTYGEIAAVIAESRGLPRMSAQAVGGAVGHNPISILIPCHRCLGAGGRLTGYAGGLEKKEYLLNLEGAAFTK